MQQVNLYQPILRKQEKVFSAKTMLQGNLVVLGGLLSLYLFTNYQGGTLQEELKQAELQRAEQGRRLEQLRAQFPPKPHDATLPARLQQARARLEQRRLIFAAVHEQGLDLAGGFAGHLDALARQDLPELWLQTIRLGSGSRVQLLGHAHSADAVPRYLQRLGAESVFAGVAFHDVVISRSESAAGVVDFSLDTAARDAQERPR